MLEAEAIAADAYASADQAAVRIEKRLRRYKRRLKDHQAARGRWRAQRAAIDAPSYVIAAPEQDERRGDRPSSIRSSSPRSTTALKRLSVSEAVMELDLTGTPVVVFRHAGHGRVNLVYRRPDGHIGWIDPPAACGQASPLTPPGALLMVRRLPDHHRLPTHSRNGSMPLTDLVAPNAIIPALKVNGKKQALQELAARAAELSGQNERAIFEI